MSDQTLNQQRWADAALPPLERAELLVAGMTFHDKVNLVMGNTAALAHLGIPSLERVDASCGLRGDTGVTAFPVPLALAATFDRELAYAYGATIAAEAREHGWSIILGPTLDVTRRGNSGRDPEGYGEEPLLNGIIGERVSRGMQDRHVITCLKHYTAYNQETDRYTLDIHVSRRALREIYNAPFHMAIEQGSVLSLMGSYPRVNGVFACENAELIDELHTETGWQGFMMPDFMAGQDVVAGFNAGMDTTTLYPNFPREAFSDGRISAARLDQATRRMLYAIFASGLFEYPVGALDQAKSVSTPAHKAIAQRAAEESIVLLKNRDLLLPLSRQLIRTIAVIGCANRDAITGVEGSSFVVPGDYVTPLDAISAAAGENIRIIFAQGSHGDHPLPVVPAAALTTPDGLSNGLLGTFYASTDLSGEPVAVQVMPTLDFASPPVAGLPGGWSARWTGRITSPTSGLINLSVLCSGTVNAFINGQRIISGTRRTINFITGGHFYPLLGSIEMTENTPVDLVVELSTPPSPLDGLLGKHLHLGWQTEQLIPEAVAAARQADIAVVFVNQVVGEGMDRDSFSLPGDQNLLVEAVCGANQNTIVVLNTPGAALMPWIDQAAAVMQIWYPGEAIGTALASVLFGDAEPEGRLPLTFPVSEDQTIPSYTGSGYVDFAEDIFVGYRHYQKHGYKPLFAFGHGLSYTQFEYTDLQITPLNDLFVAAVVSVTVRNTGQRTGSDVVQAYVGQLPAPVPTPVKHLAGFARVMLNPNESTTVKITIPRRTVSYWDGTWKTPHGSIPVYVGNSSVDDRLVGNLTISTSS